MRACTLDGMRAWGVLLGTALMVPGCLVGIEDVGDRNPKPDGALGGSGGSDSSLGGASGDGGQDASTGGVSGASGAGGSAGSAGTATVDAGDGSTSACALGFVDDFEDGVGDLYWTKQESGGALISETSGALQVSLPDTVTPATFAGYARNTPFDLENCSVSVLVLKAPPATVTAYAHFAVFHDANGNYAEFIKTGDSLHFQYFVASELHHLATVKYDPLVQAYWRFRHLAGVLTWETSMDGQSWTSQAVALLPSQFHHLRIGAGAYKDETSVTGGAMFDDFRAMP